MAKRLMIQINEEKCNGCGLCVPGCAEGALQIIDGKAKVVSESYCDGLGACIGECPQGALTLIEVETVPFDEEAAMKHVEITKRESSVTPAPTSSGCAGSEAFVYSVQQTNAESTAIVPEAPRHSELHQWPVKMRLISPQHPALKDSSLLLMADCVGAAYAGLHEDFLKGKTIIQVCPKFEDYEFNVERLTQVFKLNDIRDIAIVHMEVPCCGGLGRIVQVALAESGNTIPTRTYVIGVQGAIKAVL